MIGVGLVRRVRGGTGIRLLTVSAVFIALMLGACGGSDAGARPLSADHLGFNFTVFPHSSPNLSLAAPVGIGLARRQMIEGVGNADAIVMLTARAHLRLYPMLGLRRSQGAPADARAMALYVTAFALTYGAHGSFWRRHPKLPYLPVRSFEIGNEPDMPLGRVADETSLHYTRPAQYALVYEAARAALHAVDPGATAVVGGLADFGGVTLRRAESYLAAIHSVDAVGYHPYRYLLGVIEDHTWALRRWMNAHGDARVPIDANELGASGRYDTSVAWGLTVGAYVEWALCTRGLRIENVQPFWWGGVRLPFADPWLSILDSRGRLTAFGLVYLGAVRALTSGGCAAGRRPAGRLRAQSRTAAAT